ncbi:Scr1 family TA system antitoxin-like transcriptional regulator [Streptantibioticus rubrisoli]|uniref:Helix-turn-helix domain-containing protein n=1 Tax=Streptantibioticus rubrisoli TaxID=1387313 RepID=A0ABT1PG36_9ACTN|nr:helix-turn-helix transcriptional regulator [Streptantibioticus rubrisoli]MCQ4044337.1 helix-turn-helix domain-containing protein [Streptantibioticus rubrisoli]
MDEHDGTPVGLLIYGCQQRALRERAGFTQAELARRVNYSESQVRSVESGRRRPKPEYVRCVDEALGAQGVLKAAAEPIVELKHPAWFLRYVETEAEVVKLYAYDSVVLNGLHQTEAYARAVLSAHIPTLDEDEVERRVQARLERQALYIRKPAPTLGFVIEEWLLRRPVGGRVAMKAQLQRLLEIGEMRNVSIQVLPLEIESHAAFDGPLTLLETPEGRNVGYVEGQAGSTFVTKSNELSVLEQRYGTLRAQALSTGESASLIERLAGEL